MADEDYQRLGRACHCGEPVKLWGGRGRKPTLCVDHAARPSVDKVRPVVCAQCGDDLAPSGRPMYCSRACSQKAQDAKKAAYRTKAKQRESNCAHCGAGFSTFQSSAIYCGKKCKRNSWGKRNPNSPALQRSRARRPVQVVCKVWADHCATCGQAFVSRRQRIYCCEACFPTAPIRRPKVSILPEVKVCRCCGNKYKPAFTGGGPSQYCGADCKESAERHRKRIAKVRRKAAQRGATVETVDPFKVFERDGWLCRLCGISTPKVKRGTYDGDAPELDHIVALSKGGEHSYRNTQCLCRSCNSKKSDLPMESMTADPKGEGAIRSLATLGF